MASEIAALLLHLEDTYSHTPCFWVSHLTCYNNEVQCGLPSCVHFFFSFPSPKAFPMPNTFLMTLGTESLDDQLTQILLYTGKAQASHSHPVSRRKTKLILLTLGKPFPIPGVLGLRLFLSFLIVRSPLL